MNRWRCKFHISPYSGVVRAPAKYTVDHEPERGARNPTVEVAAENFKGAELAARNVLAGICLDERVWQADITAIEKIN